MREPHRAQAQQARRRHRDRQLRHREGPRSSSTRARSAPRTSWARSRRPATARRCRPRSRPDRAPRPAATSTRPAPLRRRVILAALLSLPALLLAMVPALQFDNLQWLSLNLVTPVVAVGGVAVPHGRVGEPQARRGDDGHADLGRRARRLAVVAVRAVPRRRRHERHADGLRRHPEARRGRRPDLPGDRGHRHDVPARRPLLRGPGQAPRRRGAEGAAGARRQGRRRPRRRRQRAPHPRRAAGRRRPLRRPPRREGRHRRHRRGGRARPWT